MTSSNPSWLVQLQYPANTLIVAGAAAALGAAVVGTYLLNSKPKRNDASPSALAKTHKLAPLVPFSQPGMDHTYEYYSNPEGFLKACQEKHGDTFRLVLRGRTYTVINSRDDINVMFNTEKISFNEGLMTSAPVLRAISGGQTDLNVVVHKNISIGLTPKLRVYTPRLVKNLLLALNTQLGQFPNPERIEIPYPVLFFNHVVGRASASVFLGEDLCQNPDILNACAMLAFDLGAEITAQMGSSKKMPRWIEYFIENYKYKTGKVNKHSTAIRKALEPVVWKRYTELMAYRKTGQEFERAADVLQDMIEEIAETQGSFSTLLDQVVVRTVNLIFASIHTTSMTSTRTLYFLLMHPQYLDEIKEEQKEIFTNVKEGVELLDDNETSTKKMKKLDSFIREVLRMSFSGIQIEHLVTEDTELSNGFYVPKNDMISPNYAFVHGLDSELASFDPWRHMETRQQAIKVSPEYMPFGLGPHACPGRFFAVQEIKSIVALILRRFDIQAGSEGIKAPVTFAVPGNDITGSIVLTPRKD